MSSSYAQREVAVYELMLPQLQAEGYSVFLHPTPDMLPAEMSSYRPDAIAIKDHKKLAIEIVAGNSARTDKIDRIRELLSNQPDWELRVIYAPASTRETDIPVVSKATIEHHLERIGRAAAAMGPAAALLIAWAAFEAAARLLEPENFSRPQTPARLLEALASDGSVTPDEAAMLRRFGELRNEAAHGRLDLAITLEQVEQLIQVTRMLLDLKGATEAAGDHAAQ